MLANLMEREPRTAGLFRRGGGLALALTMTAWFVFGALPSRVHAQCGLGGNFSGPCVDLEWRPAQQTVFVGETVEIGLFAVSVNAFNQPVQAVEAVLGWDPALIELLGNTDACNAGGDMIPCTGDIDCPGDSTCGVKGFCNVPCFTCPADAAAGTPASYNWISSGFPNDMDLDGLNDPFAGLPANDGDAFYLAISQLFCDAPVPPAGLLVTTVRFVATGPGTVQVSMLPEAPCAAREKRCLDVTHFGIPCVSDSDCGGRVCEGGPISRGNPCTSALDCLPDGFCPDPPCGACFLEFCCNENETSCTVCSFAGTRVSGGNAPGDEVTGTIGPPAQITILSCQVPTAVSAAGPRYLNVTPEAGTDPVALLVTGVDLDVPCVSAYVQANGLLGPTPVFKTPDQWMFDPGIPFRIPGDPVPVRGLDLVGGKMYAVQADCDPVSPGTNLSDPVAATLWRWGDVDNNNDVNIIDVLRIVDGFVGAFHTIPCLTDTDCANVAPHFHCNTTLGKCLWITRENVDIIGTQGCAPDRDINILDVLRDVDAFVGVPNPCTVTCP